MSESIERRIEKLEKISSLSKIPVIIPVKKGEDLEEAIVRYERSHPYENLDNRPIYIVCDIEKEPPRF